MHCMLAHGVQCMLACNAFTFSSSQNPIWRPAGALLEQVILHIYNSHAYYDIELFNPSLASMHMAMSVAAGYRNKSTA